MIGMQYKITLPNDYDMNIIRNRVAENGHKTDGFHDLLFKAYLIADSSNKKEYAPFYIWKDHAGMNQFIFDGFYDNILASFGWQTIQIAIPYQVDLTEKFNKAAYVLEIQHTFKNSTPLSPPSFTYPNDPNCLGKVLVYNPDKWNYVEFYFMKLLLQLRVNLTLFMKFCIYLYRISCLISLNPSKKAFFPFVLW